MSAECVLPSLSSNSPAVNRGNKKKRASTKKRKKEQLLNMSRHVTTDLAPVHARAPVSCVYTAMWPPVPHGHRVELHGVVAEVRSSAVEIRFMYPVGWGPPDMPEARVVYLPNSQDNCPDSAKIRDLCVGSRVRFQWSWSTSRTASGAPSQNFCANDVVVLEKRLPTVTSTTYLSVAAAPFQPKGVKHSSEPFAAKTGRSTSVEKNLGRFRSGSESGRGSNRFSWGGCGEGDGRGKRDEKTTSSTSSVASTKSEKALHNFREYVYGVDATYVRTDGGQLFFALANAIGPSEHAVVGTNSQVEVEGFQQKWSARSLMAIMAKGSNCRLSATQLKGSPWVVTRLDTDGIATALQCLLAVFDSIFAPPKESRQHAVETDSKKPMEDATTTETETLSADTFDPPTAEVDTSMDELDEHAGVSADDNDISMLVDLRKKYTPRLALPLSTTKETKIDKSVQTHDKGLENSSQTEPEQYEREVGMQYCRRFLAILNPEEIMADQVNLICRTFDGGNNY